MVTRKPSQQVERRFVREFVINEYPKRQWVRFNAPLGIVPEALQKQYPDVPIKRFQKWRRYVDAVVMKEKQIILIEGKIHNIKRGVGDLEDYLQMLKLTPEFKDYMDREIVPTLVIPYEDPYTIARCDEKGFTVKIYLPNWLKEYLKQKGIL